MIQAVVTPQKKDFDMAVSLPADYVGKEVHVLFFIDDEVRKTTVSLSKKNHQTFSGYLQKKRVSNLTSTEVFD